MFFKDVIGQDLVKKSLINQVTRDSIPHAQILLGKIGSGALAIAMAHVSYIMCKNRTESDSCGECSACNKTHKFIHPDVHFSFPVVKHPSASTRESVTSDLWLKEWREILKDNPYTDMSGWLEKMKADDKQANINVKECNDIRVKLGMMTYEGDTKVLIMWLPEFLGKEGNRLLKLIEEPTDNTYIILVSENQEAIIQTILSRCRITQVPAFRSKDIVTYLTQNLEIGQLQSEQISNLVNGNLNEAIQISKGEEVDYSDKLIEWLRHAYTSDPSGINTWINGTLSLSKDDQKNFLHYGLHFLRQYIFWTTTNAKVSLTYRELETAKKMTAIINISKAEKISHIMNDAIYHLQRNANARILFFADTLLIGRILRAKD